LSDAQDIAELSRFAIERGLPWSWTPSRVARQLRHPECNGYCAKVSGKLIGFSIAQLGFERSHLLLLAVEKTWRRKGIGQILLDWQLVAAQSAGLTDMTLEVRAGNLSARLFYERAGFRFIQVFKDYYGSGKDAIRMRHAPTTASPPTSNNAYN